MLRVSAVSYINTWPLVWGFQHGPRQGQFEFRYDLPAQCAAALESGAADIGLVPCAELDRLGLDFLPDLGIACEGPVRSIYLISRRPYAEIQTLAADSSSRTSVALTRILLAKKYGIKPRFVAQPPDLAAMLEACDAALIIGDPALRLDPAALPYRVLDLGAEWVSWSGLPMVFAVWAGKARHLSPVVAEAFDASFRGGQLHLRDMASRAHAELGFDETLAYEYLTRNIVYRLEDRHREGLRLFRQLAAEIG